MTSVSGIAAAQTADNAVATTDSDVIVVHGIRGSLQQSMEVKRNAHGVVDAITAEDIGKFPDTNLAESLQRIPGVSIDRNNGEGSTVTVRGWGPEFNLVTLNGRQMPASSFGDGGGSGAAPSSRSFDFSNLASENIAAVEVYKTARASEPSGGIGSTINIRTQRPFDRPGFQGAFSVKAIEDESRNDGATPTPEISGLFSDTFADNTIGFLISGSYQKRDSSTDTASVGWREGFTGAENAWGTIPNAGTPGGDPPFVTNHPCATCVYSTPQNAAYDLHDVNRERINGQAVLQWRPVQSLTATLDYTYSQNTVEDRDNSIGIWMIDGNSTSSWGAGQIAAPISYSEDLTGVTGGKDLSMSGALTNDRTINRSTGFNLRWDATDKLTLNADYHDSSAQSAPDNKYGTNISVGTAVFGMVSQGIDYTNELPVIWYTYPNGQPYQDAALRLPTGNAFRTVMQRDEIKELQLTGNYAADWGIIDSIDFGYNRIENNVRSAFGVIQNDTWGGIAGGDPTQQAQAAADLPDDIFHWVTLPDKFSDLSGSGDPRMPQGFYTFDFERMVGLLDSQYHICSKAPGNNGDGNCIAQFSTDRRFQEDTDAAYLQFTSKFDIGSMPANLVAGVRYEKTTIDSTALVPVNDPTTAWVSANEESIFQVAGQSSFTTLTGDYSFWLPSADFDIDLRDDLKLRLSAGRSLTRPTYDNMQGGISIGTLFRTGATSAGGASAGNPGLLPNVSNNYDVSLEWYYGANSYVAIGYFRKDVSNFIGQQQTHTSFDDLRNPALGPRALAAIASGISATDAVAIRNYIAANYPSTTAIVNNQLYIYSTPDDPLIDFLFTQPTNSDQKATVDGWEFSLQHTFGETGFGVVVNYTLVSGDLNFDNTQPHTVSQFALTGLSDSANAIAFYDKNGLQVRVAYNWRDQFYAGGATDPSYIEPYGQVDMTASYDIATHLTAFMEGINVTGEERRGHRRSENEVTFVTPGAARWGVGLRYTF
ncbi:MAG: TonB-dependent receptor [Pseudomonadota bacterium]